MAGEGLLDMSRMFFTLARYGKHLAYELIIISSVYSVLNVNLASKSAISGERNSQEYKKERYLQMIADTVLSFYVC